MKTPLNCVLMFLESMTDLRLPEEARGFIEMIECQINMMLNLVCDFQDVNLDFEGILKAKIGIFEPADTF